MTSEAQPRDIDDEWLADALQRFAATRDPQLREEIAARTTWMAVRSARRFWDRGEPFDDLLQVAQIGLLKSIDRFDPSLGGFFGSFATPTIVGELRRHFRDHTWSLHVPRRAKEGRAAVNAARDELARELQRSPRVDEIAQRLHMPVEHVIESLESNNAYRSQPLTEAAFSSASAGEADFEDVLDHQVVRGLLDLLAPRERKILTLRFFDGLSQERIAEQIGTSQVHVGRLIEASLRSLRIHLDAGDDAEH